MRRHSRNRFAFGALLTLLVFAAGLLLRAQPPQAVGTWASIGATPDSRVGAAAVALPGGVTLIAGGSIDGVPTDTVVLFNPADGSFASAGTLLASRVGHTATLLDDGRVLIAGGSVGDLLSADLEVFDPSSGTSALGATMAQPRTGHAAAKLSNGTVLIVGGTGTDGVLQTAEIYDPQTGSTSAPAFTMLTPRTGASATTLLDGRVLIAGGNNGSADLASAEIYEPWWQFFEAADTPLSGPRSGHTAVLLPNNNSVLIAGGSSSGVAQQTVDLFVPAEFPDPYSYGMGRFASTGPMAAARSGGVGAPHIEGYAFVAGGGAPDAEVYRFATIKTDKDDYAPGTPAIITGSGWQPNEDVKLLFQEDPAVHDDYVLHVTADEEGNLQWDRWTPEAHDLGVRFYLTATGSHSRAQTTFTDSRQVTAVITPTSATLGTAVTYTLTVTNTSATGEIVDSLEIAIPAGAGTPSALSVVATDPGPTVRTWSAPTVVGSVIRTSRSGASANGIDQSGTIAVTFTATATTTGTKTWAVTPWTNNNFTGNSFPIQAGFSQPSVAVTPVKTTPTITFGAAPTPTYLGSDFVVSATTTNTDSAALTYSVVSGPCTFVSGATFHTTGAGTCRVQASGAATTNFNAASNTQDVTVAKATPTVTFGAAPTPTYLGGPFTVSATTANTDSAALTYSRVSGPCALVSGASFSSSGAGACVVQASGAATANFEAASNTQTVTIAKATSTTTFGPAPTPTYLGGAFTVSASNDSGAAISYSVVSGPCALVSGATFSSSGAGTCKVQADTAVATDYLASSAQQDVTIAKATPTVTFGLAPTPTYLGGPFTVSATTTNTDSAALTYSVVSGPCALVSGANFSSSGAGTCVVQASGAATANFTTASNTQSVAIAKATPTVTFGAAPTPTYLGGPFTVSATTTNTDSAALTYSVVSGPCALENGATFSSSGAGTCVVQASGAETANFTTASNTQSVAIAKATPTVTFGAAPTPTYLGGPFTVSATTTNTDSTALTYSVVSGPCALVSGATFSSSGAGTCVAQANGAETTNFHAASTTQNVTIAKATPTVTFGPAPTPAYLGGPFTVSATTTNTDSAALTYSVVSGPCALESGATFSSSGAGTCVVQASGAITANFEAASNTQTVTIAKAPSTTTFGAAPTPTYLGGPFAVIASNDSGAAISYSVVSGPCAVVSGATFSSSGAGTCKVQADTAAATDYLTSSAQQDVTIAKATPTVTFGAAPTPTYLSGPFTVSATTTNTDSAALTYSVVSGPCALESGATFSSSGAGTCVVQASGAETANFHAAATTQDVTIAKATPTVTFGPAPTPTYLGGVFTVSATTTNTDSAALTYSVVSGPCALESGATFSSTGAGTCVIQANGAETANFTTASNTQTITIAKATPTVTFGAAPTPTYLGGSFTVSASTTNTDSTTLTYSVVSGPCALESGATFSSSGAGTCVVQASGAETANFHAASTTQDVTIAKATPTVTFGPAPTPTYLGGNFTVNATTTNTDSAALTYSVVSGPCALESGATFSSSGAGTCVVQASGAETANFHAASTAQDVAIAKATPTVTFGAAPTPTYLGGHFTVNATTTNTDSTALTYSVVSGPCALESGATFSSSGAGTCVVQASGAETANFHAALTTQDVAIAKATPTVTFDVAPTPTYLGGHFTVNATTTNTDSAALTYSVVSGPCALESGATFASNGAGTCVVQASGAETVNFTTASNTQSVTIAKATPTVTFGPAPTPTYLGGPFTVSATTTNTDSAALTYSVVSGPCALESGATFSSTAAGTCVVQASGAATANFEAASNTQTVTIAKATPTVTFGPAPTPTYLGGNFTVNATTTNTDSAALTYSVVSGPCALESGATFSSSGAGTCVVQANGAETANFQAAATTQDVTIAKATPTVTFGVAPTATYLGAPFTVGATTTNTDSAALTYSVVSGPCALDSGATFGSSGAGTCVVQASGAETANFHAASTTQDVTIAKATPTVTFGAAPTPTYLGGHFTVNATTTNTDSTALTYSVVSGPCALESWATFSSSGAGACVVQASGAETANFHAASNTQTVTIAKATPTVTFDVAPTPTYLGGHFTVNATTSNTDSAVLTYSRVSGPCALVSGATFSSSGAGTCIVQASGAATTNFEAASNTQTVTIAKATPTVTFGIAPTPTYLGGNFTVNATTTNTDSAALTYSRVSGPCALVSGATFSSSGAGTCIVQASGVATTNFEAASNTQTVTIAKATPTVTFGAAPTPTYLGGHFTVNATTTNTDSATLTYSVVSGPCALASGATFSSSGAGTCIVQASGAETANFTTASNTQSVAIAKAPPTVTFGIAPTPTYLGGNFTVSATTTNTDSAALTYSVVSGPCALVSGATFSSTAAGTCVVQASGAETANFTTASNTQSVVIAKANPSCTVTGYDVIYNGAAHTATGSCTGVSGEPLTGLALAGTKHTDANTYNDSWTFTDVTGNYNNTSGAVADKIRHWTTAGFYQPVDMSNGQIVWNTIKGGSTVPLKFNLYAGTEKKTNVLDVKGFAFAPAPCEASAIDSLVEFTTTGGTSLRYDGTAGQYIQNWQTPKTTGKCYVIQLTAMDESTILAYFKTK